MFPVQTSAVRSHSYSAVFHGLVSGLFVPNIIPSSVSPYCLRESIVISPKSFSRGYTHSVYVRVSISSLTSQETRLNTRSDLHTSVIGRCQTSGLSYLGWKIIKCALPFQSSSLAVSFTFILHTPALCAVSSLNDYYDWFWLNDSSIKRPRCTVIITSSDKTKHYIVMNRSSRESQIYQISGELLHPDKFIGPKLLTATFSLLQTHDTPVVMAEPNLLWP